MMKILMLSLMLAGPFAKASVPQFVVPNESEVLAAYSTDKELVRTIQFYNEKGYSPVDTSVVSVSEGTFLVSTYLQHRAQPKLEPQTIVAVVTYRKNASLVRVVRAEAVRLALLTLSRESL